MTAILAIFNSKKKTGVMVADSRMSGAVNSRSNPKIRRVGNALIASSGALSGGQFVDQRHQKLEAWFAPDITNAAWPFAAEWRKWCADRGHTEQDQGLRCYPSHFLILSPHGLFEVCRDGEVLHHPPETRAAAIGIGAPVCMGAAFMGIARYADGERSRLPENWQAQVATDAVHIAIDLCDGCAAPVQVELLEVQEAPEPDPRLADQLLTLIKANDIDRAVKLCSAERARLGEAPLAMAFRALVLNAGQGVDAVESAFNTGPALWDGEEYAALVAVRDALLERAR